MLYYLSVSQKQWNVCLNLWQSNNHRKMRSVSLKFSTKTTIQLSSCWKCCLSLQMRILSLQRHWSTALSTMLCFSSAMVEMRRCTENHIYSVLLEHGNNVYQVYSVKCLFQ